MNYTKFSQLIEHASSSSRMASLQYTVRQQQKSTEDYAADWAIA